MFRFRRNNLLVSALVQAIRRGKPPILPQPKNPLLFASLNNGLPNNQQSSTLGGFLSRIGKPVGSGDLTHLALRFDAWIINASSPITNLQSVLPIAEASLEYNGVVVPVTFNGSRSKTLEPGDFDVISDEIPATAFGVEVVPRDATVFIKVKYIYPTTTCRMPYGVIRTLSLPGGYSAWFNPSVTTPSSTDAPGNWTVTGTAVTATNFSWTPHLLGRYKNADAKVWLFVGDSITMGTGDTVANRPTGMGWPALAMATIDGGKSLSYGNIAIHGAAATMLGFGDRVSSFTKYATHMHVMFGTNDFGTAASGNLNVLKTRMTTGMTTWAGLSYSNVKKVVVSGLMVRTASSDSWLTEANQTYQNIEWGPAPCAVTDYNGWIPALGFLPGMSWNALRGTDPQKWAVGATTMLVNYDAAHPNTNGYTLMANEARTVLGAL